MGGLPVVILGHLFPLCHDGTLWAPLDFSAAAPGQACLQGPGPFGLVRMAPGVPCCLHVSPRPWAGVGSHLWGCMCPELSRRRRSWDHLSPGATPREGGHPHLPTLTPALGLGCAGDVTQGL